MNIALCDATFSEFRKSTPKQIIQQQIVLALIFYFLKHSN
jgi:hypothetical protein